MDDSPTWLTGEQEQLWRGWLSLNATLPAALHRQLQAEAGLSMQDFEVLVRLTDTDEGRVRVSDLARDMLWERSRLSHHVTRMEGRGLVVREGVPRRPARRVRGAHRRGARRHRARGPGHVAAVRRLFFDGVDADDLAAFGRVVAAISQRVEAEGGEVPACPSVRAGAAAG